MIVVTGGTGFVGAAIVRALAASSRERLRVLSRRPQAHRDRFRGLPVEVVQGDVLDASSLAPAFTGARTVVNAVQFPGYPVEVPRKGLTFDRYDRQGTEAQVEVAGQAGVEQFVYVSGVGADPASRKTWYRAKGLAEDAVTGSGLRWTVLRPSWLYGPEDNALSRFITISRMSPVMPVVGDGRQALQPAFIDDLGQVAAAAAGSDALDGVVVEVGGPDVTTMDDVLSTLLDVLGRRRPLVHVPPALPRFAGRLAMLLPRPPLSPQAVEFLVSDAVADLSVLRDRLPDLRLTPLREGLETYLRS